MSEQAKCKLCGELMPAGEEMFNFHGYSGPCPTPPLPRGPSPKELAKSWRDKAAASREEAKIIRLTVKDATDAESNCNIRAEVWDQCAEELEAIKV